MKYLQHFGAAGTVTGSCHLLVGDDDRGLLVDMGMFQGSLDIWNLNFTYPSFNAHTIDNVLLTHAHLDHCGRLPLLAKMGFAGSIYATDATRALTEIVLQDSAPIQLYENKDDPLYTKFEVEEIMSRIKVVQYEKEFEVGPYKVTYHDAGHLLGSAIITVTDTKTEKKTKTICFSGDLGNSPDPLLKDTVQIPSADVVVMESTYGDKVHPDDDEYAILENEINKTNSAHSTLMIPAFSLERTQMILYMIKNLKKKGKISKKTTVYLDSPMGIKATETYKEYVELFNSEIQSVFQNDDPFSFPNLVITRSGKQSRRIERDRGSKTIVAGSGMMAGGRIVGHAARYLADSANRLLFVGYQGEETLGREIKEGATEVEIDEITVPVNAHISSIENMSAHADQKQLLEWLSAIKGFKQVVLTHGDEEPRDILANKIRDLYPKVQVDCPLLNDQITLL